MTDYAINTRIEFTKIHCGNCGGHYMIDERVRAIAYQTAGDWNCPYCQVRWGYEESEAQRLQKKLDRERGLRRQEVERREHTERQLRAQKGENTKLRKRVKAGVCPCCNRTFRQLALHMKRMHPEYES